MKIYLDVIFIENYIIDLILLIEMSLLSRRDVKHLRVAIASLISSMYVVIMLYFKIQQFEYVICKILLIIVTIYIATKPDNLSDYLKQISLFILVSVLNVGTVMLVKNFLNLNTNIYLLKLVFNLMSLCICKLFINKVWKIYKLNIKKEGLIYDVEIKCNSKIYMYKGFVDTGNTVYSASQNIPVVFAEYFEANMQKEINEMENFEIITSTLSNKSIKRAYIFKKAKIIGKTKTHYCDIGVVFENQKLSKNNEYNMILNYLLFEEKLGGIKI